MIFTTLWTAHQILKSAGANPQDLHSLGKPRVGRRVYYWDFQGRL
jgi:hypothetical protein